MVARTHAIVVAVLTGGITACRAWMANANVEMFDAAAEPLGRDLRPVYEACYETLYYWPRHAYSFRTRMENKRAELMSISTAHKMREGETYVAKIRVTETSDKVQFLNALLYRSRAGHLKVLGCQSNWNTGLFKAGVKERSNFPEHWLTTSASGKRVKTALEFGGEAPGAWLSEFGGHKNVRLNEREVSKEMKDAFNHLLAAPRATWMSVKEAAKRGAQGPKRGAKGKPTKLPDLADKYSFQPKAECLTGDLERGDKYARNAHWRRVCSTDARRVKGERAQCADVFSRTVYEVTNKVYHHHHVYDLYEEKELGEEFLILSPPTLREGAQWVGSPSESKYGKLKKECNGSAPHFTLNI